MYESPITQIAGEIQTKLEDDCLKVARSVGFDINREELIRALQYDRGQYNKGFNEGYDFAIDQFSQQLKDVFKCMDIAAPVIDEIATRLKES